MLQESQREMWPRVLRVGRCFVKRNGKILIVRRSGHDVHNAGKWEVPGGKVERGQSVADAQLSETWQETRLRVRIVRSFVCSYSYPIEGGRTYKADFSVAEVIESCGEVALSHEHTAHAWVSYQQMLEYDLTDEVRVAAKIAKRYLVSKN